MGSAYPGHLPAGSISHGYDGYGYPYPYGMQKPWGTRVLGQAASASTVSYVLLHSNLRTGHSHDSYHPILIDLMLLTISTTQISHIYLL
jgi:hypothetical protein